MEMLTVNQEVGELRCFRRKEPVKAREFPAVKRATNRRKAAEASTLQKIVDLPEDKWHLRICSSPKLRVEGEPRWCVCSRSGDTFHSQTYKAEKVEVWFTVHRRGFELHI